MGEDIGAVAVKDVAGAQAADHSKQGELPEVQESSERKTTAKEVDNRFRGSFVEPLEAPETDFVVVVEDILLCFAENQGGETTKKSWRSIEQFNTKGSSRIATVASG